MDGSEPGNNRSEESGFRVLAEARNLLRVFYVNRNYSEKLEEPLNSQSQDLCLLSSVSRSDEGNSFRNGCLFERRI